jgi:hypothetical protein
VAIILVSKRSSITDFVKGTVDMRGYLDWLNQHDYNINMAVH